MLLASSAICTGAAFLIFVVLEIARHLHYLKHRDSGFVPSTQHWCMYATFLAGAFELAAIVLMVLWVLNRDA